MRIELANCWRKPDRIVTLSPRDRSGTLPAEHRAAAFTVRQRRKGDPIAHPPPFPLRPHSRVNDGIGALPESGVYSLVLYGEHDCGLQRRCPPLPLASQSLSRDSIPNRLPGSGPEWHGHGLAGLLSHKGAGSRCSPCPFSRDIKVRARGRGTTIKTSLNGDH